MTLQTNADFQRLLAELAQMGDAAKKSPAEDPIHQQFIKAFPASKLRTLTLDEYCVGKGDGASFSWWLERGLQPVLGRYMPGTSRGHLLYFFKDGSVYKHRRLKEMSDEAALSYTLSVQATIAEADASQDLRWIDDKTQLFFRAKQDPRVTMGHGRKLRLLAAYHPDAVVPICSTDHVGHFLEKLGCAAKDVPPKHRPVARILLLGKYCDLARETVPGITPLGFMRSLYNESLGLAPVKDTDNETVDDTDLDEAEDGTMPALNQILFGPPGTGKTYSTVNAALEILDPALLKSLRDDPKPKLESEQRTLLKTRFDALVKEQRIRFVTFHQSFSYEDFVEGLRADTDPTTGQLRYEVVDGVFKTLCEAAGAKVTRLAESAVEIKGRRIWKMSLGNTLGPDAAIFDECMTEGRALLGYGNAINFSGCLTRADVVTRFQTAGRVLEDANNDYAVTSVTTFVTRMKKGDLLVISDGNFKFRAIGEITGDYQFRQHPNYGDDYSQTRSVRWLRQYLPSLPHAELMNNQFSQMTLYELRPGSIDLGKLQALLNVHDGKSSSATRLDARVLIIDEINRGNVSRIFGELITLIEPSKREGAKESLQVVLPYSKSPFSVPENVYLIGTMNTADRSLAGLDVALRRRFVFREMLPEPGLLRHVGVGGVNIGEVLTVMNRRIEALLDREHCLGHAYFMPLRDDASMERLADIFRNQVIPLLQEYFFDDWQRIQWVLNDHRKAEAHRFIQSTPLDTTALFGNDVNVSKRSQSWLVNEKAFLLEQSYLDIVNSSVAQ